MVWFPLVSISNHEGSTFTEKDRNKLNYLIGLKQAKLPNQTEVDLITELDQAVRAMHSCNSFFFFFYFCRVLYFSIHTYDYGLEWPYLRESDYDYIGTGKGLGYNINVPLNKVS